MFVMFFTFKGYFNRCLFSINFAVTAKLILLLFPPGLLRGTGRGAARGTANVTGTEIVIAIAIMQITEIGRGTGRGRGVGEIETETGKGREITGKETARMGKCIETVSF